MQKQHKHEQVTTITSQRLKQSSELTHDKSSLSTKLSKPLKPMKTEQKKKKQESTLSQRQQRALDIGVLSPNLIFFLYVSIAIASILHLN